MKTCCEKRDFMGTLHGVLIAWEYLSSIENIWINYRYCIDKCESEDLFNQFKHKECKVKQKGKNGDFA